MIWIVSALALLALLGLLYIQFNWLEGMIRIREERFNEQTREVMQEVVHAFDQNIAGRISVDQVIMHQDPQEEQWLGSTVWLLMDSLLQVANLQTPFEFGLQSCKSKQFQYFSDPDQEGAILEGAQEKLGSCTWMSSNGQVDHLHLYAIYPRKSSFILGQLSGAIASALCFVLIIGGAFAYALRTIFRQRKLSEMKNDFVNNLTHEFKTPIASITLAARTLRRLPGLRESGKAQDYIDLIDQEGKRLENHVDKVLQMAAIDSGNFALDRQALDIHHLLEEVIHSLQLQLEQQKVKIHTGFAAEISTLQADRLHLFNVFYNLLDNALKYCGPGFLLQIRTQVQDKHLRIEVEDDGPGIRPEIQDHIFEPFFRPASGNLHKTKGFGLGLHYVRRLVEAHGGTVSLQSRPGQGCTFSLNFPLS